MVLMVIGIGLVSLLCAGLAAELSRRGGGSISRRPLREGAGDAPGAASQRPGGLDHETFRAYGRGTR